MSSGVHKLDFSVLGAKGLMDRDSIGSGSSDPYVKVYLFRAGEPAAVNGDDDELEDLSRYLIHKTATVDDKLNPLWVGEYFEAEVQAGCRLRFELWNEDSLSSDDFLGCVVVTDQTLLCGEDTKLDLPLRPRRDEEDDIVQENEGSLGTLQLEFTVLDKPDAPPPEKEEETSSNTAQEEEQESKETNEEEAEAKPSSSSSKGKGTKKKDKKQQPPPRSLSPTESNQSASPGGGSSAPPLSPRQKADRNNRRTDMGSGYWVGSKTTRAHREVEELFIRRAHERHQLALYKIKTEHHLHSHGLPVVQSARHAYAGNSNKMSRLMRSKRIDDENMQMVERLFNAKPIIKTAREFAGKEKYRQGYVRLHQVVKKPRQLPSLDDEGRAVKEMMWNDDVRLPKAPPVPSLKSQTGDNDGGEEDEGKGAKNGEEEHFPKPKKKKKSSKESGSTNSRASSRMTEQSQQSSPPKYVPHPPLPRALPLARLMEGLPTSARKQQQPDEDDPEKLQKQQEEGEKRRREKDEEFYRREHPNKVRTEKSTTTISKSPSSSPKKSSPKKEENGSSERKKKTTERAPARKEKSEDKPREESEEDVSPTEVEKEDDSNKEVETSSTTESGKPKSGEREEEEEHASEADEKKSASKSNSPTPKSSHTATPNQEQLPPHDGADADDKEESVHRSPSNSATPVADEKEDSQRSAASQNAASQNSADEHPDEPVTETKEKTPTPPRSKTETPVENSGASESGGGTPASSSIPQDDGTADEGEPSQERDAADEEKEEDSTAQNDQGKDDEEEEAVTPAAEEEPATAVTPSPPPPMEGSAASTPVSEQHDEESVPPVEEKDTAAATTTTTAAALPPRVYNMPLLSRLRNSIAPFPRQLGRLLKTLPTPPEAEEEDGEEL